MFEPLIALVWIACMGGGAFVVAGLFLLLCRLADWASKSD